MTSSPNVRSTNRSTFPVPQDVVTRRADSDVEPPAITITTNLTTDASAGGFTGTRLNQPSDSLDRGFVKVDAVYE
jgi:hypothetical protein